MPNTFPQQIELNELFALLLYDIDDILQDLFFMEMALEQGKIPDFPVGLVFQSENDYWEI